MKVGDYVRTKDGYIGIIDELNQNDSFLHSIKMNDGYFLLQENQFKSSPNIIDLIEVGDYVNELRVEKNKYGELYTSYVYYGGDIGKQCEVYTTWLKDYKEDEIYSILTKEQFSQMEYRIGE